MIKSIHIIVIILLFMFMLWLQLDKEDWNKKFYSISVTKTYSPKSSTKIKCLYIGKIKENNWAMSSCLTFWLSFYSVALNFLVSLDQYCHQMSLFCNWLGAKSKLLIFPGNSPDMMKIIFDNRNVIRQLIKNSCNTFFQVHEYVHCHYNFCYNHNYGHTYITP